MEKHKKIIIVFILIFVQAFLIQYVYFRLDRSIIFGRNKTIETAKAEVKQVVHERYNPSQTSIQPLYFYLLLLRFGKAKITIFTQKNL